jgi:hypothetical protein
MDVTIITQRRVALDAAGIVIAFALITLGLAVQIPIVDIETVGIGTGLVAVTALLVSVVRAARLRKASTLSRQGTARPKQRQIPIRAHPSNIAGSMVR